MSDPFRPQPADTPRARLIEATIAEIERHGLSQLTVRAVAAAADMNVAAVNYHFRSKQALVAAALESSLANMLEDTDEMLARLPRAPQQVLGELLGYYLEGCLRFPRLSKAHLHDAFVADDYSGRLPKSLGPLLERLRAALCAALPGVDAAEAARRVIAALSAVFFPGFFAPLFQALPALDTAEERAFYAAEIARQALAPLAPRPRAPRRKRK